MRRTRWLLSVPVSLALHGAGLLLLVLLVPRAALLPPLILDLTETSRPVPSAPRTRESPAWLPAPSRASSPASLPPSAPPQVSPSSGSRVLLQTSVPDLPPSPSSTQEVVEPSPAPPTPPEPALVKPGAPATAQAVTGHNEQSLQREGAHPGELFAMVAPGSGTGSASESRGERIAGESGFGKDRSQELAVAVPGTGQGSPGAEYDAYLALLRERIQQSLHYPLAARRRGLSGTVGIEIVIQPDGAIGSVSLFSSSSHRILDDAAVDTARRLPPLPFPDGLPRRTLRVRVPVVFELR